MANFNLLDHVAAPMGITLGLIAAYAGTITQKKRKEGAPQPYFSRLQRGAFVLFFVFACILFGMLIVHNYG